MRGVVMVSLISTVVCNRNKEILLVLSDGLSLFTHGGTTVLEDIFDHESKIKLNLLFEKAQLNKSALNWELTTTPQEPVIAVYCSIISWLENVIIRFSNLPIPSFFFDLTIDNEKPAALFFPFQSNSENEEKTTGYTYLTTELTYIQKELQRKNIQIEELKERLEILANIDPLTGLYNRHAIVNRLKMELVRAMREKKLLGLAVVDIDHLQEINDTFGHPIGDECLKTTANILNDSIREYDAVGRIGADEFLIVFSTHSVSQFNTILERLHHNISSSKIPLEKDDVHHIRASIGSIWLRSVRPDLQVSDLLNQVEKLLMRSKFLGGNQITTGEIDQFD
jgi:diguanylate cyclase (GGDEF)-like protein